MVNNKEKNDKIKAILKPERRIEGRSAWIESALYQISLNLEFLKAGLDELDKQIKNIDARLKKLEKW